MWKEEKYFLTAWISTKTKKIHLLQSYGKVQDKYKNYNNESTSTKNIKTKNYNLNYHTKKRGINKMTNQIWWNNNGWEDLREGSRKERRNLVC